MAVLLFVAVALAQARLLCVERGSREVSAALLLDVDYGPDLGHALVLLCLLGLALVLLCLLGLVRVLLFLRLLVALIFFLLLCLLFLCVALLLVRRVRPKAKKAERAQ